MDTSISPEDWSRHTAALRRVARGLVGAGPDADDLVQSTWLTALERPPAMLTRAWLARVMRRRAVDGFRRSALRGELQAEPVGAESPDTVEIAGRLELHRNLVNAVEGLGAPYRQVVFLRYFEELSPQEIAGRLELPVKTVKTQLARARTRLREDMERRYGRGDAWQRALAPLTLASPPRSGSLSTTAAAAGVVIAMKKFVIAALVLALGLWGAMHFSGSDREPSSPLRSVAGLDPKLSPEPGLEGPRGLAEPETSVPRTDVAASTLQVPDTPVATTGSLRVRAVWPEGDLAAGVAVTVFPGAPGAPWMALRRETTDHEGVALVRDLPPGPARVGSERWEIQRPIEVVAGEECVLELTLEGGVHVTGEVVDSAGEPVAGAHLWMTTGSTNWLGGRSVARSDAQGRFEVRHVQPSQSLGAFFDGHGPSDLVDLDVIEIVSDAAQIRLVLKSSGAALAGLVSDPDGQPVARAVVAFGTRKRSHKQRMGMGLVEGWTPRTTRTDEQGRFELTGLAAQTAELSVRAEGHPLWVDTIEVEAGRAAEASVQLEVGVKLRGVARDEVGDPVGGAIVRVFDAPIDESFIQGGQYSDDSTFGYAWACTDADGRYALSALSPGTLHVYASEPQARDRRGSVFHASKLIEAAAGDEHVWDPVIGPGPTIDGRVLYSDGEPMADVFVMARNESSGVSQALRSDESGRFAFHNMHPAPHTVGVQLWAPPAGAAPVESAGIWPDSGELILSADYDAPREEAPGSVRGRLDDAAGRVPEGASWSVVLKSDGNSWSPNCQIEGDLFRFEDIDPGRYLPIVLVGELEVHAGTWFELEPGEESDLGSLVTEPAGSASVRLEVPEGHAFSGAFVFLRPELSRNSRRVEFGSEREVDVEGLSAGTYEVDLYGKGLAYETGELVVVPAGHAETTLVVRPAVARVIEVDFPEDVGIGTLSVDFFDAEGELYWYFNETNGAGISRPYRRTLQLPLGPMRVEGETGSGLAASFEFEMTSLEPDQAPVRVDLR